MSTDVYVINTLKTIDISISVCYNSLNIVLSNKNKNQHKNHATNSLRIL